MVSGSGFRVSRIKIRFRFPAENKALEHVGVALKEGTDDTVFLKNAITIEGIYNITNGPFGPQKSEQLAYVLRA